MAHHLLGQPLRLIWTINGVDHDVTEMFDAADWFEDNADRFIKYYDDARRVALETPNLPVAPWIVPAYEGSGPPPDVLIPICVPQRFDAPHDAPVAIEFDHVRFRWNGQRYELSR